MSTSRDLHIPIEDLILEIELRVAKEKQYTSFRCPCTKCQDGRRYKLKGIRNHLRVNGRDPFLMHSMVGGDPKEGYPKEGITVNASRETLPPDNVFDDEHMRTPYTEHMDPYHDIQRQLFDAFNEGDRVHEQTPHAEELDEEPDIISDEFDAVDDLYAQAMRPIYEGMSVSLISATIVLINMAVVHGVSNAYVDELMKYLSTILLPSSNVLPVSYYKAKKLIRKLGLNYDIIHTCPDGCVLYRGEKEHLKECPISACGKPRFLSGSDFILARVIRHFPLLPRLRRMFQSPTIAKMLRFHYDHPNPDPGVMKSVADSPAWKHVDTNIDPSFAEEVRNLRFDLSLDGVNPLVTVVDLGGRRSFSRK